VTDPTVELSVKDELDWKIERSNEIAAICWQKCESCNGRGFHVEHWEADQIINPQAGTSDYVMHVPCQPCDGKGQIQLHDPWRVTALYDAADDARAELGAWCYVRITRALALAVNGNVSFNLDGTITVKSATVDGEFYHVAVCCDCQDAYHRAPKINNKPACKHQIAVWLVKAAERKMYDQEPKHYGLWSDVLDGLISVQEAERREAGNV